MNKLTKVAEDKLMGAIEKTAALVNSGLSPNDAITKAASEDGIPPGHINLMVHAYNTGRTTRQRESGSSALEKSADFPIADASVVLESLYPDQVKTAAFIEQSTAISTEYALPPTGILQRREKREKAARNIDWSNWSSDPMGEHRQDREVNASAPAPYERDQKAAMQRAFAAVDRQKRAAEEARRQQAFYFDKMAETFNSIEDYFRNPASTPIPVVKEQAMLLHGGKGRDLIDQVIKVTPGLAKMAHHTRAIKGKIHTADGEVYGLISQFLDELEHYKQARHAYKQAEKSAADFAEETLRPFDPRPLSVLDPAYLPESEKRAASPLGAIYAGSAIKSLFPSGESGSRQPDSSGVFDQLTDPDHEARLRNIQSQAMLQDLMINDPVISGYDPQETSNAYNDIVAVMPSNANQRMMMQAMLRKRLEQGSMDPFDLDQMLSAEEKQRKLTTQGKGVGDESVLS